MKIITLRRTQSNAIFYVVVSNIAHFEVHQGVSGTIHTTDGKTIHVDSSEVGLVVAAFTA